MPTIRHIPLSDPGNSVLLPLPKSWPSRVKSAVIQAVAMAATATQAFRGWRINSPIARARLAAQLEQATTEIALVREENRILRARLAHIPAHRRPHYPPQERLAILELKAVRNWSLSQAARAFLVTPVTIANWFRRLDENGPDALVQTPVPVNKFPLCVKYIVQRLKTLCPVMGYQKIAATLARAGLHLAKTTVRRFIAAKPAPPPENTPAKQGTPEKDPAPTDKKRTVTAKYPNHVWNVDLTPMPTALGFWVPWMPFSLLQYLPFCWWLVVVVDHYSRKVLAIRAFRWPPASESIRHLLDQVAATAGRTPRYIVCDHGSQFWCDGFKAWCKRRNIRPRYGAVGRYGSIALVERCIRTMKNECLRRILVPLRREDLMVEINCFIEWFNNYRPHSGLDGATPQEKWEGARPTIRNPRFEPRPNWPLGSPCARPWAIVKGQRGVKLALEVSYFKGRRHLPIVALKRVA